MVVVQYCMDGVQKGSKRTKGRLETGASRHCEYRAVMHQEEDKSYARKSPRVTTWHCTCTVEKFDAAMTELWRDHAHQDIKPSSGTRQLRNHSTRCSSIHEQVDWPRRASARLTHLAPRRRSIGSLTASTSTRIKIPTPASHFSSTTSLLTLQHIAVATPPSR